ncbi:MAG: dienelactone hydrolase family protein, partial [Chloroflexi bacterium]|nr:dienelactone hydrolase family protein [Chloroflexota bacterium]
LGFLAVVMVVVVLVGGLIIFEGTQGNARLDAITNTRIPNPTGPEIRAFVARPSTPGPHPAVIMIHEFFGLNDEIIGKAQALADEGYVVIAPDVFRGSTTQQIPRAIYQVVANSAEQVNTDVDAVMAWLAEQPDVQADRIGIMGFCFGGRTSLLYSLHNNQIAATAVLYGNPVTEAERLKSLPGPVLGIFGEADQSIPLDNVRKFEAALNEVGVPNDITIYPGQPHAFVTGIEAIRQGGPQGEAWQQILDFFAQSLQSEKSSSRAVSSIRADDAFGLDYLALLAFEHLRHESTHAQH